MKQIFQNLMTGEVYLTDVPVPKVRQNHVLIQSNISLISPGTERMLVEFGRSNYFKKAKDQPEKVLQVIEKAKTDGFMPTIRSVNAKLRKPLPLGYSNAGTVIAVGSGVKNLAVGDRVISNGHHAELVQVPEHLTAKIPINVSYETACFSILGAVALQGIRLAQPQIGEHIVVFGLGVVGLLAIQILIANGCNVVGVDFDAKRLAVAKKFGAKVIDLKKVSEPVSVIQRITKGVGVDAAIICTSTQSANPMRQAAQMCRRRGRIILVGVTKLALTREEFYKKELSFQVSCSYGPGRYDKTYEEMGIDYPVGYVRWTEQRNFSAVLELMSKGKINVEGIVSHSFEFANVKSAYDVLNGSESSLGILLKYPKTFDARSSISLNIDDAPSHRSSGELTIGLIGAGSHANLHLIPAFKRSGAAMHTVVSQTGTSGSEIAKKFQFQVNSTDNSEVFENEHIDTLVIAARHDLHAEMIIKALVAKKNVFVEKPVCINLPELRKIKKAYEDSQNIDQHSYPSPILMAGFNRRFSPLTQKIKGLLKDTKGPANFLITVNASKPPLLSWLADKKVSGGPIISEVCHFLDLMRYLSDSKFVTFKKFLINNSEDDGMVVHVSFANGSIGTINYITNGHRLFPKERIEVFVDEKILQLNNYRELHGFGWRGFKKLKLWSQDKGHRDCVQAFASAVKLGKKSPIPFEEIIEVSEAAILLSEEQWRH